MATTPGISWIKLPNGICFPLENQRFIEVQGNSLVLTDYAGGSRSIPFQTGIVANAILDAINLVMKTPVSFTAMPFISGISPVVFNPMIDQITITGGGFYSAGAGQLWVEEATGLMMDFNGLSMTCTVVSDSEMTAVINGVGDATTFPFVPSTTWLGGMLLAYRNADGVASNTMVNAVSSAPNAIPDGSNYDAAGNYSLAITAGTVAYWTQGANDTTCDVVSVSGQFTASANPIVLTGTPLAPVTALVQFTIVTMI